jgi:hypothetical protein
MQSDTQEEAAPTKMACPSNGLAAIKRDTKMANSSTFFLLLMKLKKRQKNH